MHREHRSPEKFLYVITAVLSFAIDAVVLSVVMKPIFYRHLGDAMRDSPMLVPAGFFCLAYLAGLVVLISFPELRDAEPN